MTKLAATKVARTYRITDEEDMTVALVYIREDPGAADLPPADLLAATITQVVNDPALWRFLQHVQRGIPDEVVWPDSHSYLLACLVRLGEVALAAVDPAKGLVDTNVFKLAHLAVNWLNHRQQERR